MLNAFALRDDHLRQVRIEAGQPLPEDILWLDLTNPTEEERRQVAELYGLHLAEEEDLEEIEASARFFEDQGGIHIHSYFFDNPDPILPGGELEPLHTITAALTLKDGRLFTVHDQDLATLRMYRLIARRSPGVGRSALSILLELFETKVDLLADLVERIYAELEVLAENVTEAEEREMKNLLADITRFEDMSGKVRMVLLDTQRAVAFLLRHVKADKRQRRIGNEIVRDIGSLVPHTDYIFQKVGFLMEAAAGIVNVEQNRIIKVMSVASIAMLPPTLIASIYGMNFEVMPELHTAWGYPAALLLMLVSGLAPFLYFKRKGWL